MKAKIVSKSYSYKSENMIVAHKAINSKWEQMREELLLGKYTFDDEDEAKKSKFLSEFDSLFKTEGGEKYFSKTLNDVFKNAYVIRGAIISKTEPTPNGNRFIPNSMYIKEDNRFSPKGVEWIYLALGFPKNNNGKERAKICSEKECRAKKDDTFAICEFEQTGSNVKIVDLTVGEKWTPEKQQQEIIKLVKSQQKKNPLQLNADILENHPIYKRNIVEAYANIMSSELFVPLSSKDKSVIYAPFHCIARYFQSLNYNGIIYKSTVFDKGKNIVLFNKNIVAPIESSITTYVI